MLPCSMGVPSKRGGSLPHLLRGAYPDIERITQTAAFRSGDGHPDPVGTHLKADVLWRRVSPFGERPTILKGRCSTGEHQRLTVELNTRFQLDQAGIVRLGQKPGILHERASMQVGDEAGIDPDRGRLLDRGQVGDRWRDTGKRFLGAFQERRGNAVLAPLSRSPSHIGTATRTIDAVRGGRPALALHHSMAIRVERDAATEDDGDRFFNAAVGEREYLVGFLSKGLDSGLKLRM